jgi:hydrogenase nickel incorporation protein HypA/HybF
MHELPITESILEIALRHAESAGATRVNGIYLVIGALSSFVDDSIQFYWETIGKGTIAEGAKLHFKRLPTHMRCLECELEYSPDGGEMKCPECEGIRVKVEQGDEFYVDAIDIETAEDLHPSIESKDSS